MILREFPFHWHIFSRNLSVVVFVDKTNSNTRSPRLPLFCSASIREGRVALSVGHPRGTHSRYVIGCCLIPLGICGLKNNSRRITYGLGCVWGMPSLSPLSSLGLSYFNWNRSQPPTHPFGTCRTPLPPPPPPHPLNTCFSARWPSRTEINDKKYARRIMNEFIPCMKL